MMASVVSELVAGLLLALAGLVLLLDVAGAGKAVIRGVTSRSLGSLAPGYAASRKGFQVYSAMLIAIGAALAGVGLAAWLPLPGASLLVVGSAGFVVTSVVVIRGELRTFRALKAPAD